MVAAYIADAADEMRREQNRQQHEITFRDLAEAYIAWLRDVKAAKPATLRDHGYVLGEPGVPYKRGKGQLLGHVMQALGDKPASKITTRDIDNLLRTIAATGVSARAVNKTRNIIAAAFNYGMRESAFGLPRNPALAADVRREAHPGALLDDPRPRWRQSQTPSPRGVDSRRRPDRTADQVAPDQQDGRTRPSCGVHGTEAGGTPCFAVARCRLRALRPHD